MRVIHPGVSPRICRMAPSPRHSMRGRGTFVIALRADPPSSNLRTVFPCDLELAGNGANAEILSVGQTQQPQRAVGETDSSSALMACTCGERVAGDEIAHVEMAVVDAASTSAQIPANKRPDCPVRTQNNIDGAPVQSDSRAQPPYLQT